MSLTIVEHNADASEDDPVPTTPRTKPFSTGEAARRNVENLAASLLPALESVLDLPTMEWSYNHIVAQGQSLSVGIYGCPPYSTVQRFDSLMLGQSVRPNAPDGGVFNPVGNATFYPLRATAQAASDWHPLTEGELSCLPSNDGAPGETPLEGAINGLRSAWLRMNDSTASPDCRLLGSCVGVGSQTIDKLSKHNQSRRYYRYPSCLAAARLAANNCGGTYGVAAITFVQGEADYAVQTEKEVYKAALVKIYHDMATDAIAESGQVHRPPMFLCQTGAQFTKQGVSIGQAQLEVGLENPDCIFIVGPNYQVTDKGSHLDANGYRWLANQFAKVMFRVLVLRQRWKPLYPTRATAADNYCLIDFNVPSPPLVWDLPYVECAARDDPTKGFSAFDDEGDLPFTIIPQIISETQVLLTFDRKVSNNVRIVLGNFTPSAGSICLRDSDPTVADDLYTVFGVSSEPKGAAIPGLVGKSYPLYNWCLAANISASDAGSIVD